MPYCTQGHPVSQGDRICEICGQPVQPDQAVSTPLVSSPLPPMPPSPPSPMPPPPLAPWHAGQPPAAAQQVNPVPRAVPGTPHRGSAPAGFTAAPYRFQLRRLTPIDQITAVAALILLVVLFVPWFGGSTYDYSLGGINAHSYLAFALLTSVTLIVYLALRAGWDRLPFPVPVAHAPLLLVVGAVQFLIVLIAFLSTPSVPSSLDRSAGAYIGLIAAIGALLPIAIPAIRSVQQRR